jgi:DNA polymerase II large subunit
MHKEVIKMISVSDGTIEMELKVVCDKCGEPLILTFDRARMVAYVKPCETCMQIERELAVKQYKREGEE